MTIAGDKRDRAANLTATASRFEAMIVDHDGLVNELAHGIARGLELERSVIDGIRLNRDLAEAISVLHDAATLLETEATAADEDGTE